LLENRIYSGGACIIDALDAEANCYRITLDAESIQDERRTHQVRHSNNLNGNAEGGTRIYIPS
jgi:hypothetical protein